MLMNLGLAIIVLGIALPVFYTCRRNSPPAGAFWAGCIAVSCFMIGMSIMRHEAWKNGTHGYNPGGVIMREDSLPTSRPASSNVPGFFDP